MLTLILVIGKMKTNIAIDYGGTPFVEFEISECIYIQSSAYIAYASSVISRGDELYLDLDFTAVHEEIKNGQCIPAIIKLNTMYDELCGK